jgi:uncharacterized MAPEG superfamily protein
MFTLIVTALVVLAVLGILVRIADATPTHSVSASRAPRASQPVQPSAHLRAMSAPTVNPALTPNRPNRSRSGRTTRASRNVVENDDYAAFTQRVIAAHGRRIARGDIEGLATLAGLADDIDTALREAITGLRAAGFSWADIATRLGVTRQAAQQRWGDESS